MCQSWFWCLLGNVIMFSGFGDIQCHSVTFNDWWHSVTFDDIRWHSMTFDDIVSRLRKRATKMACDANACQRLSTVVNDCHCRLSSVVNEDGLRMLLGCFQQNYRCTKLHGSKYNTEHRLSNIQKSTENSLKTPPKGILETSKKVSLKHPKKVSLKHPQKSILEASPKKYPWKIPKA